MVRAWPGEVADLETMLADVWRDDRDIPEAVWFQNKNMVTPGSWSVRTALAILWLAESCTLTVTPGRNTYFYFEIIQPQAASNWNWMDEHETAFSSDPSRLNYHGDWFTLDFWWMIVMVIDFLWTFGDWLSWWLICLWTFGEWLSQRFRKCAQSSSAAAYTAAAMEAKRGGGICTALCKTGFYLSTWGKSWRKLRFINIDGKYTLSIPKLVYIHQKIWPYPSNGKFFIENALIFSMGVSLS